MCQALLEIMEPEIKQIVRQATEKERREKEEAAKKEAEESVIKMIKMKKFTMEEIGECVPRLSMDEIWKIAAEQA